MSPAVRPRRRPRVPSARCRVRRRDRRPPVGRCPPPGPRPPVRCRRQPGSNPSRASRRPTPTCRRPAGRCLASISPYVLLAVLPVPIRRGADLPVPFTACHQDGTARGSPRSCHDLSHGGQESLRTKHFRPTQRRARVGERSEWRQRREAGRAPAVSTRRRRRGGDAPVLHAVDRGRHRRRHRR